MAALGKGPRIIGMTGGIGSGKTTAGQIFAELGAEVIDADLISRELLQPGSSVLQQVEQHFGPQFVKDGVLDRQKLRTQVFRDQQARVWLEQLLHPLVRAEIRRRIAASQRDWVLLSIPLLLESRDYDYVDSVLVVDTPQSLQIARAKARDNSSEEEILAIMAAQMPRQDRLQAANWLIHNDGDLAHLQQQVATLYQQFERDARERQQ